MRLLSKLIRSRHFSKLMINKNVMSVFAIVAVAAMMGAASIAPAYAAQKVVDDDFENEITIPALWCDQLVDLTISTKGHTTIWDNNKFVFKLVQKATFTDSNGDKVGQWHISTTDVGTFGPNEVETFQSNGTLTCVGSGLTDEFHFGTTLHKDGTVTTHSGP